jgi:hypothetical protein
MPTMATTTLQHLWIVPFMVVGLCGTVQSQPKSVTAVGRQGIVPMFNALLSNSPVSVSWVSLTRTAGKIDEQFGFYTQTGSMFGGLPATGIVLSSGKVVDVQDGATPSTAYGISASDSDLEALIPGQKIADLAAFDMQFTAQRDASVSFYFVFASEEYNEGTADVFGFWVNGENLAKIGGSSVTPGNVNCGSSGADTTQPNCDQYINNNPQSGTSLNGYTKTQTIVANLKAGSNSIRIAIADSYPAGGPLNKGKDSVVFLGTGPAPPTKSPTKSPTMSPTKLPTMSPTKRPTKSPTMSPTKRPTMSPTTSPTKSPTMSPTKLPTKSPRTSNPVRPPLAAPVPVSVPVGMMMGMMMDMMMK